MKQRIEDIINKEEWGLYKISKVEFYDGSYGYVSENNKILVSGLSYCTTLFSEFSLIKYDSFNIGFIFVEKTKNGFRIEFCDDSMQIIPKGDPRLQYVWKHDSIDKKLNKILKL